VSSTPVGHRPIEARRRNQPSPHTHTHTHTHTHAHASREAWTCQRLPPALPAKHFQRTFPSFTGTTGVLVGLRRSLRKYPLCYRVVGATATGTLPHLKQIKYFGFSAPLMETLYIKSASLLQAMKQWGAIFTLGCLILASRPNGHSCHEQRPEECWLPSLSPFKWHAGCHTVSVWLVSRDMSAASLAV